MTGRCATCKWWEQDEDDGTKGTCALTEMDMGDPVRPESLAVAADGEEYRGVLVTRQDFGCVQWEAKDGSR